MPGFVDFKTFTADDGEQVSVVTFATPADQRAWRDDPRHRRAQQQGRDEFYARVLDPGRAVHPRLDVDAGARLGLSSDRIVPPGRRSRAGRQAQLGRSGLVGTGGQVSLPTGGTDQSAESRREPDRTARTTATTAATTAHPHQPSEQASGHRSSLCRRP